MSVRELIDRRNALVVRERELAAEADKNGYSVETRKNLDAVDKDLTDAQADVERALRAEGRDFQPERTGKPPRNDIEDKQTTSAEEHARKVNREVRDFITSDERGKLSFKGKEYRAGLEADIDTVGGYTVPKEQFNAQLIMGVDNEVFLTKLATNFRLANAESLGTPTLDSNASDATWASELTVGSNDTGLTYGKRELTPHPLAKQVTVSKKLLRSSSIDVVGHVRDRLAYALSIPLESGYLNGSGSNQPLGLFTVNANAVSTAQDFTSASSSKVISAFTDIIETQYQLKGAYWRNSSWIINRFHHKDIRNMLDGNGNPVWMPAGLGSVLNAVAYDTLLTRPVYMSEYAPVSTEYGSSVQSLAVTGSTAAITGRVACFGDFTKYWTVTALDFDVQHLVELKAQTNQDLFIARIEADGAPVLSEAFAFLRLKGY